jgi:hypothetical protein
MQNAALDTPLAPLVELWLSKIRIAREHKKDQFQDDADEINRFYTEAHDFMYKGDYGKKSRAFVVGDDESDVPPPKFQMTANKVAEFVDLYGPMLYHKNPVRRVTPRKIPAPSPDLLGLPDQIADPMVQQQVMLNPQMAPLLQAYQMTQQHIAQQRAQDGYRAQLMECYLNYTPNELDLKTESRNSVDEALVKGRGLLWTEVFQRPLGNNQKLIGSFFGSVDDLFIDPDCEKLKDAQWVVRRCKKATWEVERKYGWKPGSLKSNAESLNQQAETELDQDGLDKRRRGQSSDLIIYYEIYSRMGAGTRLKDDPAMTYGALDGLSPFMEVFGDYVYLVVAQGVGCPLNINPEMFDVPGGLQDPQVLQSMKQSMAWPIPFWADAQNPWPFTEIDFHPIPKRAWPRAHMKPAMGYQKFLNWCYSMMANKIRITCRDILVTAASLTEEQKKTIESGPDLAIIEIANRNPGEFDKIMDVLKMLPMNADLYKICDQVELLFEKATGMTDIIYGMQSGPQIRSAQEAALKGDMTRIRPDAMANVLEDAMGLAARKEAMGARWILQEKDIAPVIGPDGAKLWTMMLFSLDVWYVVREFDYRIEAGSTKKPNRDLDLANSNEAGQFVLPTLMQQYMATGDPTAVNALMRFWAKARDIDPEPFMLKPMQMAPPPPPGGPPAPGPSPQPQPQPGQAA